MGDPGKAAVPIAPGNFDRAWNDPPLFSYNEASGLQKPSNRLNRRVAYPVASGQPPPTEGPAAPPSSQLPDAGARALPGADMPPPPPTMMPGSVPPPPVSVMPAAVDTPTSFTSLPLTDVSSKLKVLIEEHSGGKGEELVKRLDLMEKSLNNETPATSKITQILSDFTQLLERKDLSAADKRLTSLGADYPAECAQWIICLRHLLANLKSNQVEESSGSADITTPFFMPVTQ